MFYNFFAWLTSFIIVGIHVTVNINDRARLIKRSHWKISHLCSLQERISECRKKKHINYHIKCISFHQIYETLNGFFDTQKIVSIIYFSKSKSNNRKDKTHILFTHSFSFTIQTKFDDSCDMIRDDTIKKYEIHVCYYYLNI